MCYSSVFTTANEDYIAAIRVNIIQEFLREKYTVIVDNTNLNPLHIEQGKKLAEEYGVEFEIMEFPTPLDICVARDKLRVKPVGEKVIRDMARRWRYNPA